MKLSQIIKKLQAAQREHGDLPVHDHYSEITEVIVIPYSDGRRKHVDGIPDDTTELVVEMRS